MKKETVEKILSDLESGYDLVAGKFSSTRAFMWRDLEFVRDLVKPEDWVLDFGCGNGRLAGFLEGKYRKFIGVDISQKLIDLAKQKYSSEKTEFIKVAANNKRLPFKDDFFDTIFSIAVFHHLPGKKYRLDIARELHRVLKPEGKIVVSVWSLWQGIFWKHQLEAVKDKLGGKSNLDWKDIYIPFQDNKKNVFKRYHHAFTKREFKKLLAESGFEIIYCKKGFNIICVASKK